MSESARREIPAQVRALHDEFLSANKCHTIAESALVRALVKIDRQLVWRHFGYASIYDYALEEVDWKREKTESLLRMGKRLLELPEMSRAYAEGRIETSKVREISRVASANTEKEWLEQARQLPCAKVERLVAHTSPGLLPGRLRPGEVERPLLEKLTLLLKRETIALLNEAIEIFRGDGEDRLDRDQAIVALVAAARRGIEKSPDAKSSERKSASDPGIRFDPRHRPWILLIECPKCQAHSIQTRDGDVPLVKESWAALSEDALVIDPVRLAKEAEKVEHGPSPDSGILEEEVGDSHGVSDENPPQGGKRAALPMMVARLVYARGKFRCETPGCTERKYLEVGHIRGHRHGGPLNSANLFLQCFRCNEAERLGLIRLEGPYERLKVFDRLGRELTAEGLRRAVGSLAEPRAG